MYVLPIRGIVLQHLSPNLSSLSLSTFRLHRFTWPFSIFPLILYLSLFCRDILILKAHIPRCYCSYYSVSVYKSTYVNSLFSYLSNPKPPPTYITPQHQELWLLYADTAWDTDFVTKKSKHPLPRGHIQNLTRFPFPLPIYLPEVMASLNLSSNGPSISKSYQTVVNAPPPSGNGGSSTYGQWAVYSVSTPLVSAFQQDGGKESVLKVQSTGG